MKIRKYSLAWRGFAVSLFSLLMFSAPHAFAAVNNCTWTGATNNNFNVAGNWSNCGGVVPQTGDNLTFDNTSLGGDATVTNDIVGLSVGSVTFSGAGTFRYTLDGNSFTVTSGIINSTSGCFGGSGCYITVGNNLIVTGNQTITDNGAGLELSGNLSGTGKITLAGNATLYLSGNNASFSGGFANSVGLLDSATPTALGTGTTTITNGGSLILGFDSDISIATPLSIGGNGDGFDPAIYMSTLSLAGDGSVATLTGPLTLTSDIFVGGFGNRTLKIAGTLSGSYELNPWEGDSNAIVNVTSSSNTSKTPSGILPLVIASTDLQPSLDLNAYQGITFVVDGSRGNATVQSGSTLKGSGKVGTLTVDKGGILAPGHSPGCISSGNLTMSGTYQVEIGGTTACTGYDQTKVTGTVDLTGGTLTPILYGGFKPAAGQSYTIIDNDGADAVTGTFSGISEGGTITADGITYSVTYKGGDGNDVVLTVKSSSTAKAPDTGFNMVKNNPMLALVISSAAGLVLIGQSKKAKSRK